MGKNTLFEEVILFALGLISKGETKKEAKPENEEKPKIKRKKRRKITKHTKQEKKMLEPQKEEAITEKELPQNISQTETSEIVEEKVE